MINGCRFTRHSEINSADIGKHHYKSHTEHNLNKSLKKSKRKFIYPKTFSLSQGKLLQSKLSSKTSDKFLSKISSKPKEKQLQHKLSVKPQENRIQNVLQEKLPCVISSEPDEKISILKVPSEPRKKISSKMPAKHRQKFMRFKSEERQLRQKPSVKPEEKLPLNDSQGKLSLCAISPELEKKTNLKIPSEPKKKDNFKTLSKSHLRQFAVKPEEELPQSLISSEEKISSNFKRLPGSKAKTNSKMLSEPKKRSPCSKSSSIHEGKFLRSKIVSKPEDKSPDDKISFLPNEAFPCDYCEFEADSIRNLRQHGLIHSILYHMCGNSGKFYLKSDLFSHLEAEHPHIAYCYCDLCGREFTSVTAKMCHRRTCMQEELFTCKQCHKIFYDIIAFKQHERTHEN